MAAPSLPPLDARRLQSSSPFDQGLPPSGPPSGPSGQDASGEPADEGMTPATLQGIAASLDDMKASLNQYWQMLQMMMGMGGGPGAPGGGAPGAGMGGMGGMGGY